TGLPGGDSRPLIARRAADDRIYARRRHRRNQIGARAVLQPPRFDRAEGGFRSAGGNRLQTFVWATADESSHAQQQTKWSRPLRMALVLGLRQRRFGKSGNPSNGYRSLGAWRQRAGPRSDQLRRPLRL